jgi:predicted kinase
MEERFPTSKRAYVAALIADAFNDRDHLPAYVNLCQKHGLTMVLRAFAEAKSTPESRIRRSRAALFRYLVNKYASQRKQDYRP